MAIPWLPSGTPQDYFSTVASIAWWSLSSFGMMVCNKLAISAFPLACTLVAGQMGFAVLVMLVLFPTLHFGSLRDCIRWSFVAPFFTGTLLTSILALKHAPMSMVVVFRVLAALVALGAERLFPKPIEISSQMVLSMVGMMIGCAVYAMDCHSNYLIEGLPWIVVNMFFAVGDRLLQRMMLAREQRPVDISTTGVTLISNFWGAVIVLFAGWATGELTEVPAAVSRLKQVEGTWIILSCVVGTSISFAGVIVQRFIAATSFLVLVNVNNFAIILVEAFAMGTKTLTSRQLLGAFCTMCAGLAFATSRKSMEAQAARGDKQKV